MADDSKSITLTTTPKKELADLFLRTLHGVREDVQENTYLAEAMRVLPVGGYRSAIGSVWNAVVDDLRSKIMHRSVELFNKSINIGRKIEIYEDFQNFVNDDQLIEGAYKIGVIGWEASKILKHAKETRHVFDGHPRSSEPSIVKVLSMLDDCVKYVLSQPFPSKIIDIDDYISQMGTTDYDRNEMAIENALTELPEVYKIELVNRLYSAYVNTNSSSIIRSNIEFAVPILWNVLTKEVKNLIARKVDQEITAGNTAKTALAFAFIEKVEGQKYLSITAKRYKIAPLVENLRNSLDQWNDEEAYIKELEPYSAVIPDDLTVEYVRALVLTYVGYTGSSSRFSRTDFYSDAAALRIPKMFQAFDDKAAVAFIDAITGNVIMRRRISNPAKLNRLRTLGNIVSEKVSEKFTGKTFLEALVDPGKEMEFFKLFDKKGR